MFNVVENPTLIQESDMFAFEGEDVTLHCNGAGEIEWFYERHQELPKNKPISFKRKLHIHLITKRDEGYYYCSGSSVFQTTTIAKVLRYSIDYVFIKILGEW